MNKGPIVDQNQLSCCFISQQVALNSLFLSYQIKELISIVGLTGNILHQPTTTVYKMLTKMQKQKKVSMSFLCQKIFHNLVKDFVQRQFMQVFFWNLLSTYHASGWYQIVFFKSVNGTVVWRGKGLELLCYCQFFASLLNYEYSQCGF